MKKYFIVMLIAAVLLVSCAPNLSEERVKSDTAGAMKECAGSPADMQSGCYMRVSEVLRAGNPNAAFEACFAIKDDNEKRGCYEDTYNAQNSTDAKLNLCKKVDISDMKKGCLDELIPKLTNATEALALCNEVNDDVNFKEHCLNEINLGDDADAKIALCDARDTGSKDNCYHEVGTGLFVTNPAKGIEICNKISGKDAKYNCLNYFIGMPELIKMYPSYAVQICDSFTLKDNCYMNVAQTISLSNPKMSTDICKKMSDETQEMFCYGENWFSYKSNVVQNFDYSMSLCKSLDMAQNRCYRNLANTIASEDPSKAEQACRAMLTDSDGCLHEIGTS